MSGVFFDYTPGRLDARFSHCAIGDYIRLHLTADRRNILMNRLFIVSL